MESDMQLTVSELTSILKKTLETSFYGLTVTGEVSGFRPASTGHWYFSLKDDKALINAVIWRSTASRMTFVPKDGQMVTVSGSISLYEARGSYQIVCTSIKASGTGDILAMLEERKKKYQAMGWFDPEIKKQIPQRPNKVALITSPTGAALQDMLQITGRRNNGIDIIILPAVVQGDEAAASIAKRIDEVNKFLLADVMIVGRGGGSIEDLLPFSDDIVIKAIHESLIPVISAVGHEIDWALSDYVADMRAPTPSAAAELVCASQSDQMEKIISLRQSMHKSVLAKLNESKLRAKSSDISVMSYRISSRTAEIRMKLESLIGSSEKNLKDKLHKTETKYKTLCASFEALSPYAVLSRGYAIVQDETGKTITDASETKLGSMVNIRMKKGSIKAQVRETNKNGF